MASWERKDYYQSSESENEEEVAIEKLKERAQLINEEDYLPDLAENDLDFNELTQDEQLELVERHSPELIPTLEEFQYVIESYKNLKEKFDGKKLTPEGESYLILREKILKLLMMHFAFYVMLKAKGKPANNHPALSTIKNLLKMNKKLEKQETAPRKEKRVPKPKQIEISEVSSIKTQNLSDNKDRRAIEAILKNKGIKRKRKKIERNVRVKNKMKYLKKVKTRQSTYGYVERTKQNKYGGESTGIRKDIVKSVKIK